MTQSNIFIPTPIITFNIVMAGGFRTPAYAEVYGPPRSGKSAFAYSTAAMFQEAFPEGKVHILDQEMSVSTERLKYAFNIDFSPEKMEVKYTSSIEDGFHYIVANSKDTEIPRLFIWDSIAAAKPEKEIEAAKKGEDVVNVGGLGLKARVLEEYLATTGSVIQNKPILVIFLNQVRTTGFGTFKGPHSHYSSGGNALKHWCHYIVYMNAVKKEWSEQDFMDIKQQSTASLEKTKFSPCIRNVEIEIDESKGGVIVDREEIHLTALKLGIIEKNGSWYKLPGVEKSMRWDDLVAYPGSKEMCIGLVTNHYREKYVVLNKVYEEQEKEDEQSDG